MSDHGKITDDVSLAHEGAPADRIGGDLKDNDSLAAAVPVARGTYRWFCALFGPDHRRLAFAMMNTEKQREVIVGLADRYPSKLTDAEIENLRAALAGEYQR